MKLCLLDALPPIRKSLSLNPNYLPALNLYVILLTRIGDIQAAIEISSQALRLDPQNAIAHKNHAVLLLKKHNYLGAFNYFQTALQIDPNLAEAQNGLLKALWYGDRSVAINYFQTALEHNPNSQAAKDSLLETLRSQYLMYRWISFSHGKGKAVFILVFPLMITINYAIQFSNSIPKNIKHIVDSTTLSTAIGTMIVSSLAWLIFNYPLQFDKNGKNILNQTDLIFSTSTIYAIFIFIIVLYLEMLYKDNPFGNFIVSLILIIGGAIMPIINLPYLIGNLKSKYIYLSTILGICMLGAFNLICLLYQQNLAIDIFGRSYTLMHLYTFIVLMSPVVAIEFCSRNKNK